MERLKEVANQINQAQTITVLTGAGVSTASGIPDFRSSNGLWSQDKSREYYMSKQYFFREPEDFWHKYKEIFRLKLLQNYEPNIVHHYLRELETNGKHVTVVTQNVDGLHTRAGNENVIEYHGNLNTATCPSCETKYTLDYVMEKDVPYCNQAGCGDVLKPDIVLFGDMITEHEKAEQAIAKSDFVLVLGTSLLVTPFSLLPDTAHLLGIPMAIINRESTLKDVYFDYIVHDDLSKTVSILKRQT